MERPRYFVALYEYDPRHMSPNPNAPLDELSFRKGQVMRVYGTKDMDGFYRGELHGRVGLVPGNMVAELSADEAYGAEYGEQRTPPRRQSDSWQNTSDPALASYRGGYYEPGPSQLDPRMRRLRFGQTKSQSYDHPSEYSRRVAENSRTTYARRGEYPPGYYEPTPDRFGFVCGCAGQECMCRRFEPPYSARAEYARGSLDRRERMYRDRSMPNRTPSEDYRG
jgi:hypothetical protein